MILEDTVTLKLTENEYSFLHMVLILETFRLKRYRKFNPDHLRVLSSFLQKLEDLHVLIYGVSLDESIHPDLYGDSQNGNPES